MTFVALISLALAIWAIRRTARLKIELSALAERLQTLEAHAREFPVAPGMEPLRQIHDPATPLGSQPLEPPAPSVEALPAAGETPWPSAATTKDVPERPGWDAEPGRIEKQPTSTRGGLSEAAFASRWLVWLGSVALLLAGAFLVKYSIDNQLLSPGVRVFLGFVLGVGLAVGGEVLRRRPIPQAIAAVQPDQVPPALTAAGVTTAFASIYAGHVVYDLFPLLVAFAALSMVALGALALSLLQGRFIAVIGLVGAMVIPLLVRSPNPSFWGLYIYLLVISSCAIALVRYRSWWWLAGLTILGSAIWDLAGMIAARDSSDLLALIVHLLAIPIMVFAARFETLGEGYPNIAHPFNFAHLTAPQRLSLTAGSVACLLSVILVRSDSYSALSLAMLAVILTACIAAAARLHVLEALAMPAAVAGLIALASWHLPRFLPRHVYEELSGRSIGLLIGTVLPPEIEVFAMTAASLATGFALAAYAAVWRSRFHGYWAALSTGMPLAAFIVVYWRLHALDLPLAWGAMGLGLASAATFAATRFGTSSQGPDMEKALGCYVLGVVAALSLGASMTLEHTWLTLVLATQLPVMAWAHGRFGIGLLRPIALATATIVIVRLVMLNNLPLVTVPQQAAAGWILYSYAPPVVAFWLAARWFRRTADDRLVAVLEAGVVAIGVTLVSLEIRSLIRDGNLIATRYDLLEASLHSIAWLTMGYGLYRRQHTSPRPVEAWAAGILIAVAAMHALVVHGIGLNPLFRSDPVGTLPFLNVLVLAFGIPGILALLIGREARRQGHYTQFNVAGFDVAGALGLLLILANITLEVRRAFQGPFLAGGQVGDAEGYAYSLVWLVCAGILLGLGIAGNVRQLRFAALCIVVLAVAKVFLWDMASLDGLYRVASFLGLGLSLVGVGYLYQRFVTDEAGDTYTGTG